MTTGVARYTGDATMNGNKMKVVIDISFQVVFMADDGLGELKRQNLKAQVKGNIYAISSDTQQLQFLKLRHFKLERF